MPLTDEKNFTTDTISYDEWKLKVGANRIRHFSYGSPTNYIVSFGRRTLIFTSVLDQSADITDFETNYLSSSISASSEADLEKLVNDDSLIGYSEGPQQKAFEFTSNLIYVGYADFGVATSSSLWTIKRINLDGSGNPTLETWTATGTAIWDNRTSETYL